MQGGCQSGGCGLLVSTDLRGRIGKDRYRFFCATNTNCQRAISNLCHCQEGFANYYFKWVGGACEPGGSFYPASIMIVGFIQNVADLTRLVARTRQVFLPRFSSSAGTDA